MSVDVRHGDCREAIKSLADCSIDSCVTDPPYSLVSIQKRFGKPGQAPAKFGKDGLYQRASSGFMGATWDTGEVAHDPAFWGEVIRVLKPGAHLVAFAGTRTYHRMTCAIEDAGFEIRDQLAWCFGSGFPKSHDVSKGIDKRKDWGALKRLQHKIKEARSGLGISQSEAARRIGLIGPGEQLGGGGFMWFETGLRLPTRDQYAPLKAAFALDDECDAAFEAAEREVVGQYHEGTAPGGFGEHRFSFNNRDITAPATGAARTWEGWGTALKPAWEPVCLARKPLSESTIAANVLRWGCGALNIDGCRIGTEQTETIRSGHSGDDGICGSDSRVFARTNPPGRWPANLCHDGSEEVIAAFPQTQSGEFLPHHRAAGTSQIGTFDIRDRTGETHPTYGDSGSAARFFYSAKADSTDRLGSKHPTVKPVDLMRWLTRLVTPPHGVVLDPFAGTGTTGMACMAEGFDCILIEREAQYIADIKNRIAHVSGENGPLFAGLGT